MGADEDADSGQPAPPDIPTGARRSNFTPASPEAARQFFAGDMLVGGVPIDALPPDPSSAVDPPAGSALPRPPQRKSRPDDDLLSALGPDGRQDGVLDAIEQLQEQLLIREQEAREFRRWESSMLAIGTTEALDAIEQTRSTFTESIQIVPAAEPGLAEPPRPAGEPAYELVEPELAAPVTGPIIVLAAPVTPEPNAEAAANPPRHPSTEPPQVVATPDAAPPPLFSPEPSGAEPTPPEHRTGRAFRLFLLWFSANSSVLGIVFGGLMLSLGMSLRQTILAALAGVALSFLPIGLATLASKWGGQPTMVVSRASFGLVGNTLPGLLSLATRLLWGGVLLWLLASVAAQQLDGAGAGGDLNPMQLTVLAASAAFLLCLVIAFFGYRLLVRVQLVLSVLSGTLIAALIAVTWPAVDLGQALTVADGPWMLVPAGGILVFSFIGLVWSTSAGDLARYQRPSGAGSASMLAASFGGALPPFVLIAYGALLAASNPSVASGFVADPVKALVGLVPAWFLLPLIGAVGIGLLASVILSIYSGGFALLALATRLSRESAVLIVGVVVGCIAIGLSLAAMDFTAILRDLATSIAVPTAAWLGIFAADAMIRNRRFDTRSLVQPGGVYPAINWVNLSMLPVASAIGYGFTTASVGWLAWQGYLFAPLGIAADSEVARADLGVLAALAVGLLTPIVFGIRTIRKQEAAGS